MCYYLFVLSCKQYILAKLCYHALEMMEDNKNTALTWLFDCGHTYLSSFRADNNKDKGGNGNNEEGPNLLTDGSFLEEIDEKKSLLSEGVIADNNTEGGNESSDLMVSCKIVDGNIVDSVKIGSLVSYIDDSKDNESSIVLDIPGSLLGTISSIKKNNDSGLVNCTIRLVNCETG